MSYVFANDLKSTLDNTTVRPDVVNMAFGYPGDGDGVTIDDIMKGFNDANTTFSADDIAAVQAKGTRVFLSLGGWTYLDMMAKALNSGSQGGWEHSLAQTLSDFVVKYNLDGIDVDMEFAAGNTTAASSDGIVLFMFALHSTRIGMPKGTNLTYTIQTPLDFNDKVLKNIYSVVDWVNVMEYSSPSADQSRTADLQRYVDKLHIPADKLSDGTDAGLRRRPGSMHERIDRG